MSEIIENMPYEEYAKRPGINATLLKIAHAESLKDVKAYIDGKRKESGRLDFGKCLHSLGLEGREDFVEIPENYTNDKGEEKPWNWNANACKKWGDEQGDMIPLKVSEVEAVQSMASDIRQELGNSLKGRVELSLFAEMKGLPVKCRIDLVPDDPSLPIIDLKSCASAEPTAFTRSADRLGYFIQAAFIIDVARKCGIDRSQFDFLAVESDSPHATYRMQMRDEPVSYLHVGRLRYRTAMQRVINAMNTNYWPGYGTQAAENVLLPHLKDELTQAA